MIQKIGKLAIVCSVCAFAFMFLNMDKIKEGRLFTQQKNDSYEKGKIDKDAMPSVQRKISVEDHGIHGKNYAQSKSITNLAPTPPKVVKVEIKKK